MSSKQALIFKENPNSQETGEVMPGTYYLDQQHQFTANRAAAKRFSTEEAEKFCSRGGGWDWTME